MDGLSHRNVESTISYELPYNESSRRITLCRPSTLDKNHQEEGEVVDIPPGAVLIICTTGQLLDTRNFELQQAVQRPNPNHTSDGHMNPEINTFVEWICCQSEITSHQFAVRTLIYGLLYN